MQRPLIYISYGMPKTGSTLAFRLVCAVLQAAGIRQDDVDLGEVIAGCAPQFVDIIRPAELSAMQNLAETRAAPPIAVKTHSGLWGCVQRGLDEGWIIGHAVARDPRDMALSILDAERESRAWGTANGKALKTLDDVLPVIRNHIGKFEAWAAHPAIVPLAYEPLAFDTASAADRLARQLGVSVDAAACARAAHRDRTNFNRGRPERHQQEMDKAVSARIGAEFAGFIARWCAPDFRAR